LKPLEADCQALKIVDYKRGWTLTYDAVTGDPWVRVDAETGQVLGLMTDMKIELDQARHLNADRTAFEKFVAFLKKAGLIATSLHIYTLMSSQPGVPG
jgi:hypothetical protein